MSCDGSHPSPGTYRTRHAPGETLLSRPLPVAFAHPAAELTLHPSGGDGDGVPLVLGHDHSFALYPGHILRVRARQPTTSTAGSRNSSGWKRRGGGTETHTNGGSCSYQLSYLGSFFTIPSFSRPAKILAVSCGVPVTTCTLVGLHSSTAPFTKSATANGSEGTEARERTPTLAPRPPCLKEGSTVRRVTAHDR